MLIPIAIIMVGQYEEELWMTNKVIQRAIDIAGSQKKLADLCGVSQPTVWRWLHGGGIDSGYVMKISDATNGKVKTEEILTQSLRAHNSAA
ncbi:MAG: YdaS family helix-turn-helix protein [Clostridiales bacterium]|nr:YdaS family helix-turn-helix protein [Clostridiales bacterium]